MRCSNASAGAELTERRVSDEKCPRFGLSFTLNFVSELQTNQITECSKKKESLNARSVTYCARLAVRGARQIDVLRGETEGECLLSDGFGCSTGRTKQILLRGF